MSVLIFWFDLRIYHKAHNVFELVSFLAKFIAGNLELVRKWAKGCYKTLCSLLCGYVS